MEKSFYRKDSEAVHLWIHLLFCAHRSEREEMLGGKKINCLPGQFTTGRKQLSNATGISESKVERLLAKFESNEYQIEQQKTNTNRLISILNWSEYQSTEQQMNNKRTTTEQQMNTLQEIKKLRSKEIQIEVDEKNWRNDFNIYLCDCRTGYKLFNEDNELIKIQQRLNPGINIKLSIEKGFVNFWGTEAGWKNKKSKRTKDIDWKATIINSINTNRVFYTKQELTLL